MVYCVAVNCKNGSGSGARFFSFPDEKKDRQRREAWISSVKRKDWKPSKHSKLCSDHFQDDCFVVSPEFAKSIGYNLSSLRLKNDAVPSIFYYTPGNQQNKIKAAQTPSSSDVGLQLQSSSLSPPVTKQRPVPSSTMSCSSSDDGQMIRSNLTTPRDEEYIRKHRKEDRKGNISPTADDETSQYCEAGVVTDVVENPKDPEGLDRKGIISPTADDRISQCCEAGVVTDVAENPKDPKGLVKRRHSSNGSVELHSDSMKRKPFKSEISADEYTISKEWEFVEIKKEPNMLKDKCDENDLFHVSVKEEPIGDTMEFVKQEHDI